MKSVSQALEQTVDMAANLEDREIGLAILPCSTSGDILAIDAPCDLLAAVADSSVSKVSRLSFVSGYSGLGRHTEWERPGRRWQGRHLIPIRKVTYVRLDRSTYEELLRRKQRTGLRSVRRRADLIQPPAECGQYTPPLRIIPTGFQVSSESLVVQLSISLHPVSTLSISYPLSPSPMGETDQ